MRTLTKMGYAAETSVPIVGDVQRKPGGPPDPFTFARYSNYLSFSIDEPVQQPAHFFFQTGKNGKRTLRPEADRSFRQFVKERTTGEEVGQLDFEGFYKECPNFAKPLPFGFLQRHQVLWSLAGQYCAAEMNLLLNGIKEKVKQADPNLDYTVTITPAWETWGPCGSFASIPDVADMAWTDIYAIGRYKDRFLLNLLRSCGKKTVLWNGWNLRSAIDYRRSCLAGLTHSEGLMTFTLTPYYPAQAGWSAGRAKWVPGGYEVARDVFTQAAKNEEYLSPTQSTAKIAILCSERTMWNHYYAAWGGRSVYLSSLIATYTALLQHHYQVDTIFTEHIERPQKLSPYRVILAFNTESFTAGQEDALRSWVRGGGTLIATAETSRFDRFGRKKDSYGLEDVFHAKFVKQYAPDKRVPLEQFKKMQNRRILFSRDFGPGTLMGESTEYDYIGTSHTRVYDSDIIEITEGGRSVAVWNDGGDAAVWGRYGQGRCLFFAGKWMPFSQDFRKLTEPVMRWVNREAGLDPLLTTENAAPEIEFHVRSQPKEKRLVIHVTNLGKALTFDKSSIDPKTANYRQIEHPTENVVIRLKVPDNWRGLPGILEAGSGRPIERTIVDGRLVFTVPQFGMYSLIVVASK
ncbi:MAG: hypothetical protein QGF00_06385 [Planctomycetota bacterium]|nr:hypothetical protein [Planctomycetota bacterium]MDP7249211.1 hypothetical protein [Planctomycetota bacterium]